MVTHPSMLEYQIKTHDNEDKTDILFNSFLRNPNNAIDQ